MEGGNPLFCDQLLPNPFVGLAPFAGTSLYTNATISPRPRWRTRIRAFGGLTQQMRNDGKVWYNSLQVTYEVRLQSDLNLLANYTLSKSIDQDGSFNDYQNGVLQRSVSQYDRPHNLTVASVYNLPFGKGKRFLNSSNGVVSRLVSGWQNTVTFTYSSGLPWALPTNVMYVKDATIPNIDWSAPDRSRSESLRRTVERQRVDHHAGVQHSRGLHRLQLPDRSAVRAALHSEPRSPASPEQPANGGSFAEQRPRSSMKGCGIQFRAEAFNLTNTYWFGRQQFNSTATSSAFGTMNKASLAFTNTNQPRYVQLGVKFLW